MTEVIGGFDPILISLIRKNMPSLMGQDICDVQPMSKETGSIFSFKFQPQAWCLPDVSRFPRDDDDVTLLLILGYKYQHGHNCCTGFGQRGNEIMGTWYPPGHKEYPHCTQEKCHWLIGTLGEVYNDVENT